MALSDIHKFVDGEAASADDLNSIGEAVSQEIGSGLIGTTSLVWPLVAQGNVDMNGYAISNSGLLFGQLYVNDDMTLNEAIIAARAAGGGTIVIEAGHTATAANIDVGSYGSSGAIRIIGDGNTSEIAIGASLTDFGIKFDSTCDGSGIEGVKFSGGTAAKPGILADTCDRVVFSRNTTLLYTGPLLRTQSAAGSCNFCDINFNMISTLTGNALEFTALSYSNLIGNKFNTISGDCIYSPSTSTRFSSNCISKNNFVNSANGLYLEAPAIGTQFSYTAISDNVATNCSSYGFYIDQYAYSPTTNNATDSAVYIRVRKSTIVGNAFMEHTEIGAELSTFSGNFFNGNVTFDANASNNSLGTNRVAGTMNIDSTSLINMVGNDFATAVYPTLPAVYGFNNGVV